MERKKIKKKFNFEIIDVKECPVRNVLGKRFGRDSSFVADGTIKERVTVF